MGNRKVKYSFAEWCRDNGHQDWLDLWDYELNDVGPQDVAYKSSQKYWFKCARGLHHSELKIPSSILSGRTHLFCRRCASFGQWVVDNLGNDSIEKYWSDKNLYNWFDIAAHSSKETWIKCSNNFHPDYRTCPDKFTDGYRCPVCSNKKIIAGINDVATTHPQFVKYFKDETDATKYSISSGKYTWFKCPLCGNEKYTDVCNAFEYGHYTCLGCGDGVSYGNKFVHCFLRQLRDRDLFVLCPEKTFEWSKNLNGPRTKRVYDFYINDGADLIVEVHGRQHYEYGFDLSCGGRSVQEEQENDLFKYNIAIQHGIHQSRYIVLDCRESKPDFIKRSIMTSALPKQLRFNECDIDWEKCHIFATSNLMKMACDLWGSGMTLLEDVANTIGVSTSVVSSYLYQGDTLGLIIYESKTNKPVICSNTNQVFISSAVCSKYSQEIFGVFISRKSINSNANHENNTTHGLQFEYITRKEFRQIKESDPHRVYE